MADLNNYPILSVCATVKSRLSDLVIKDGQLIFIQDKHKIALDYNGRRVFYHQITELETESARASMLAPVAGTYYFVIDTAVLWTYQDKWIRITTPPEEIVSIGTEMPELGCKTTLYVNKNSGISIWDEEINDYVVVADKNEAISESEIDALFVR